MPKLHVLTNKSELKKEQISDKVVIVLDILIATSSIVTALANGCKEVVPVRNYDEALALQQQEQYKGHKFSGELNADTLSGFIQPTPIALLEAGMQDSRLVYCTTNGTVALTECKNTQNTYVGSLLNAQAVTNHLFKNYARSNILIVCSGSSDQFNIEDFYGAGYFVECLLNTFPHNFLQLSDSAMAAKIFHDSGSSIDLLNLSRVGQLLNNRDWQREVVFAAQKDIYSIVPYLTSKGNVELIT
jgi:2-phosphosulfolactate phosphatase